MNKPIKPNITIPESFAKNGIKTDFDSDLIAEGFDNLKPDVLAGDNLNKFIDDTYQGLNYGMAAADAINLINEGETLTVVDGKLTSGASGGGLEIGDIGVAPLGIDETKGKRRLLNGSILDINANTQGFVNKLKSAVALYPNLACTEEEWQATATLSAFGACGKFVIDETANTVRLPKITGFIQGLTDLSSLGNLSLAGLPNIQGTLGIYDGFEIYRADGAFFNAGAGQNVAAGGQGTPSMLGLDASRSNSIYGNSTTVQPESVRYPYFIQVATGAEDEVNIVNELETNIPFYFGYSFYSSVEPNNVGLLKSAGQNNLKADYPDYYDWLLRIYNGTETANGVSVKLSTDTYNDYDFVLNTANETFRLPLKTVINPVVESNTDENGNWYKVYANGFLEQGGVSSATGNRLVTFPKPFKEGNQNGYTITASAWVDSQLTYVTIGEPKTATQCELHPSFTSALCVIYWQASGQGEDLTNTNLYFYVGDTAQNTGLINAGRFAETLATKTDMLQASGAGMPSGQYINLTLGTSGTTYTAPTNGYVNFMGTATAAGQFALLKTQQGKMEQMIIATSSGNGCTVSIPVAKGHTFIVDYNLGSNRQLRFTYAVGSESEV